LSFFVKIQKLFTKIITNISIWREKCPFSKTCHFFVKFQKIFAKIKKVNFQNCFSSDVISVKIWEMVLKKSRNWRNGFHWRLFKKNFWSWRRIKWVMFKNVIIIVSESQIFRSFMPSTQNGSVNFVSNWRFSYDQDRIRIFQRCFQGRKLEKKIVKFCLYSI